MFRLITKLLGIAATLALAVIVIWLLKRVKKQHAYEKAIRMAYRTIAWIIGLSVTAKGQLTERRPLLVISNHIGYLDIIAYGCVAPVVFTPKAEIAKWPVVGFICRLLGCVFIERKATKTQDNMRRLYDRLNTGSPVLLFPEGTTGDGIRMLPFKSSFFNLAKVEGETPVSLQPALLRYTRLHGLPLDKVSMPQIAWYGDMELLPHAKHLLSNGPIEAEIEFMPPIDAINYPDRKAIAAAVEDQMIDAQQRR